MPLNDITNGNKWCPYCAFSKLERITSEILDKLKIKYEPEKKFKDLKNIKELKYDFFIPEINTLIELDGMQHFEYRSHFHNNDEKIFKKNVITDIKKNYYAIKNNYNFFRISYLELDFLEKYLTHYIEKIKTSNKQVIYFSNPKLYKNTYLFK